MAWSSASAASRAAKGQKKAAPAPAPSLALRRPSRSAAAKAGAPQKSAGALWRDLQKLDNELLRRKREKWAKAAREEAKSEKKGDNKNKKR